MDLSKVNIPSKENIDKINKLYVFDEGWEIVYFKNTSKILHRKGLSEHICKTNELPFDLLRGSVSERDLYQLTKEQLESWGCKFDELIVGYRIYEKYF